MKKLFFLLAPAFILFSCNNGDPDTKTVNDSTKVETSTTMDNAKPAMNYAYQIDKPDNWVMGSSENTMAALAALKAFENGDINEAASHFGDSVRVQFDGLDTKVSNDSLKVMFKRKRDQSKTINIKMDDWESVVSKDKSQEWVTMWYTEHSQDMKGKVDSVAYINDLQLKNGKIVRLDQYSRKLH